MKQESPNGRPKADSMTNSYALPSAQNKQFMAATRNESLFRSLATIVNAPGMTAPSHLRYDIATWLGDGSYTYRDGVDDFKRLPIGYIVLARLSASTRTSRTPA